MGDEISLNSENWEERLKKRNPLLLSSFLSLGKGVEYYRKRKDEENRYFCVKEIQSSLELGLKSILLKNGEEYQGKNFHQLIESCKELGLNLGREDVLKELNTERNNAVHEGKIPDRNRTEYLIERGVKEYLETIPECFNLSNSDILEKVPNLMFMEHEEESLDIEKPEILRELENASSNLFLYHRKKASTRTYQVSFTVF